MFNPIELDSNDPEDPNGKSILRIFKAIRDVSREKMYGQLRHNMEQGDITEYSRTDLELAYSLYQELV